MSDGLIKTLGDYIKFKEKQMSYSESDDDIRMVPEDVFEILSDKHPGMRDMYSRDKGDWLEKLGNYDLYNELVTEVAKNRKNPAFKELIYIIEAAIESEIAEDENDQYS